MLNVVEPNDLDQFDECKYNKLLLLKYEIVHTSTICVTLFNTVLKYIYYK